MTSKAASTKQFAAPPLRPWLQRTEVELICRNTVLHVDIFAYTYSTEEIWYCMKYSLGGRVPVAQDWFLYSPEALWFTKPDAGKVDLMRALYWVKATAEYFNPVHRALVQRADDGLHALPECNALSVHCHYIRVLDADPWPRDFVNSYRGGRGGPNNVRVRKPKPRVPVADVKLTYELPDWL